MCLSREPSQPRRNIRRALALSLALTVLATWGADGRGGESSADAAPPPVTPELLPPGPLPGKPVQGKFRGAGLGQSPDVHEFAVTGKGARRTALLIARSQHNQLCIGIRTGARARKASLRCLRRWDRPPMLLRIGIGGESRDLTDWIALVGLVRQEVNRVTFETQHLSVKDVPLRGSKTFPWKAFAVTSTQRGNLPVAVRAHDASDLVTQNVDLGWAYGSPCPDRHSPTVVDGKKPRKCKGRRRLKSWSDERDPIAAAQSPRLNGRRGNRSKALAVDHPTVRSLIAGQSFSIDTLVLWSKCNRGMIGAIVQIRLTKPVSFEGDVPIRGYQARSHTAYVEGVAHVKAQGMLLVWVAVDLNRSRVVGIDFYPADFGDASDAPGPRPTIETQIVQPPKPAGGADSGNCESKGD
jgi:hypothetical protein